MICTTGTCKIEGRPVVNRGSNDWQSQRDINGMSKPTVFEHGQALIVIHGDNSIDALQRLSGKSRVGGQWALNKMAAALEIFDNGRNDVNFLPTEITGLASMRVQTTDADARLGNAKVFPE